MPTNDSPMLTRDPGAARLKLFADAHEVAPDVLHARGVRQHLCAAHAGRAAAHRSRLRAHRDSDTHQAVRAWSDAPLHTAVYTHGHADHAFGLRAFLDAGERPQIIAQENCLARFQRYQLTYGWNARINQRQFSLPEPMFPRHFDWPTLTFRDSLCAAARRSRSALPRRQGRDRRRLLGVGAGARATSSPAI